MAPESILRENKTIEDYLIDMEKRLQAIESKMESSSCTIQTEVESITKLGEEIRGLIKENQRRG